MALRRDCACRSCALRLQGACLLILGTLEPTCDPEAAQAWSTISRIGGSHGICEHLHSWTGRHSLELLSPAIHCILSHDRTLPPVVALDLALPLALNEYAPLRNQPGCSSHSASTVDCHACRRAWQTGIGSTRNRRIRRAALAQSVVPRSIFGT